MQDVGNACLDIIDGQCCGHGDFGWQPCHSVSDTLGLCVRGPYCVAAVRVEGGSEVPTVNPMGGPAAVYHGLVMDDDADARRGNRCSIKIKRTMKLRPGRQTWVYA